YNTLSLHGTCAPNRCGAGLSKPKAPAWVPPAVQIQNRTVTGWLAGQTKSVCVTYVGLPFNCSPKEPIGPTNHVGNGAPIKVPLLPWPEPSATVVPVPASKVHQTMGIPGLGPLDAPNL